MNLEEDVYAAVSYGDGYSMLKVNEYSIYPREEELELSLGQDGYFSIQTVDLKRKTDHFGLSIG